MNIPFLENICRNFEIFQDRFTLHNENFKRCYIFENKHVTRALENREWLHRNIFGNEFYQQYAHKIFGLKYCDFYNDVGMIIPAADIVASTGRQLRYCNCNN